MKTVANIKSAVVGVEFPLRLIVVLLLGCREVLKFLDSQIFFFGKKNFKCYKEFHVFNLRMRTKV